MAIAETGATLVAPSPQAARATNTGMGSRHSGLGAQGSHSFAALVSGIAEESQAPDDIAPGDDAGQQQGEQRPHIDRGRTKPASNGQAVSARRPLPGEAAAEQKDTADVAQVTCGPRHSKTASVGSDTPPASKAATEEWRGGLVVADPQAPPLVPGIGIEPTPVVEPLAHTGPAVRSAPPPSGAPAQSDEPSSTGTVAPIGPDASSADVGAAAAAVDTILEAVGSTRSKDVDVSVTSKPEVALIDGPSKNLNASAAIQRGAVQGRHSEVRGIALSAVREALTATVQSHQPTDGSDAESPRIESLSANASAVTHDVPSALAAYSLVGSSGVEPTLASKSAASQSTEDAPSHDGLEKLRTELMQSDDRTPLKSTTAENRSTSLRSWGGQTATTNRSALIGASARTPGVAPDPSGVKPVPNAVTPVPNGTETYAQLPSVPEASEVGVVASEPQRPGQVTASRDAAIARRTFGAHRESSALAGAVSSSTRQQASAELAREAGDPVPSEAIEALDGSGEKPQAATPPQSVDVPVPDAPRVAVSRRSQAGIALQASPASVATTSKAIEHGTTSQITAINPTDTIGDTPAGPARQTRQSAGHSAPDARNPSQLDSLAEQNPGAASTTATSAASPARKIEVVTQAAPKPTGTAAIAIAAFQAAAAAAPDLHRSASIGGTSVMSAALLDAQVRTPIVDAIRFQADNGNGQVRLRLNPEFLGDVSVDVRVNGGSVVASVHASNAEVREWLRSNEAMLRQTLADQGLHLERLVIAEEDAQPGKDQPDDQRGAASDQQREWERRSRRPRDTGTFEVML